MPFGAGGEFVGGATQPSSGGGGGSGTVTSVSVTTANGFAGTVATASTTPAITIKTTVTGILKGNGTAVSAGTAGTDYSAGTAALATGLLKSTTGTGNLSIAAPGTDYLTVLTGDVTTVGNAATLVGTSNVESIIRANSLDQMAPPVANLSMNSQRLTTMGQGIVGTDAPDLAQLVGNQYAYVVSGCVWTADAPGSTRLASMTAGTVMIKGILLTVAAVTSRTFTASNDTYVDITDSGNGTAAPTYTAVPNYTISPALPSSGTQYNTLRVAVLSVGATSMLANGINQGNNSAVVNAGSAPSSTVAVASNGASISATPLNIASSASFPSGGGWAQVNHSGGYTSTIQYTGTAAGQLTGVTLISGGSTVSTGDTVTGVAQMSFTDMLGNLFYNTNPFPKTIGYANYLGAATSTLTSAFPQHNLVAPFNIPPGVSKPIRVVFHTPILNSSAAAGQNVLVQTFLGNALSGTALGAEQHFVAVASDGVGSEFTGYVQAGVGSNTAQVKITQSGAGTVTLGLLLATTFISVEYA